MTTRLPALRMPASVSRCPRSNLKLANGVAPVAKYCSAGINVALGTDGAASNNMLDMFAEMQAAALPGKLADLVCDAWVGGKHQLENGRLTQVDRQELVARADEWRDRIAASDKHAEEVR